MGVNAPSCSPVISCCIITMTVAIAFIILIVVLTSGDDSANKNAAEAKSEARATKEGSVDNKQENQDTGIFEVNFIKTYGKTASEGIDDNKGLLEATKDLLVGLITAIVILGLLGISLYAIHKYCDTFSRRPEIKKKKKTK